MGRSSFHLLPSVLTPASLMSFFLVSTLCPCSEIVLDLRRQVGEMGLLLDHPDRVRGLQDPLRRSGDHDQTVLSNHQFAACLVADHVDHVSLSSYQPRHLCRRYLNDFALRDLPQPRTANRDLRVPRPVEGLYLAEQQVANLEFAAEVVCGGGELSPEDKRGGGGGGEIGGEVDLPTRTPPIDGLCPHPVVGRGGVRPRERG